MFIRSFSLDVARLPACLAVAAIAWSLFVVAPAQAQSTRAPDRNDGSAGFVQIQNRGVSLQQAIAIATERVNGRVVRADTVMRDGRVVHEVLIIRDDGLVRTVHVDAATGNVL